jgi:putative addiction module component (TIGR02574 family)
MTSIDYSHLSPGERLDLIGEIWDSIEADYIPLAADQAAELDRRYATLDEDIKQGKDAFAVYKELTAIYR